MTTCSGKQTPSTPCRSAHSTSWSQGSSSSNQASAPNGIMETFTRSPAGGVYVVAEIDSGAHLDFAGRRERRVARVDRDRAAHHVAAEQRALRALEHLDAAQVRHLEGVAGLVRLINAVDVDCDRRVLTRTSRRGR